MTATARNLEPAVGWDTVAKVTPVAVVLLPAIGTAARWISFAFDPEIPSQVVLAASLTELTATGFSALLAGLPFFVLVTISLIGADTAGERDVSGRSGRTRSLFGRLLVVAMILF